LSISRYIVAIIQQLIRFPFFIHPLPQDMTLISAGTFQMGNSKDASEGWSDELPVHTVTVDSFAMGKYEITNGQYCEFLNATQLSV